MMTGSGSALFGIFPNTAAAEEAVKTFPPGKAFRMRFVTRRQYVGAWRRALSLAIGPVAANGIFA
jgi:4-diphosphocytidyl-2C-methyl-D-erythritol kinase